MVRRTMPSLRPLTAFALILIFGAALSGHAQETLPAQVAGTWRIVRILPTSNPGCWEGARSLVGTTITYRPGVMHWHGGDVPLTGVTTRSLSADSFQRETVNTLGAQVKFTDLNIQSPHVLEVDLQHEDADITGSTTEVPGDSILLSGRNSIVVSACGSFFEATRVVSLSFRTPPQGTVAQNHSLSGRPQMSVYATPQRR